MNEYINGIVTYGNYFTYKGERYGKYTKVLFTEEFYKRIGEYVEPIYATGLIGCGWKFPYFRTFSHITTEHENTVLHFGGKDIWTVTHHYVNIDPEIDIEKIVTPVWYFEPKELVKLRLNNGSWILYVWPHTLVYLVCLLLSPIFKQWYLIWTIGLYVYMRLCYIELSKGELNRGW